MSIYFPTRTRQVGRLGLRSWRVRVSIFLLALAAMSLSACLQEDASPDPFIGPSELGLSLTLSASPDVLELDGASQSLLSVHARDGAGQAIPNVTLRLQIRFGGILQDVGALSARTVVTGQDGRALATYTAPIGGSVDGQAVVEILVTPVGNNYASALPRTLAIRLVPRGIVIPPQLFSAGFRFTPTTPIAFQDVLFQTDCLAQSDTNCVRDPGAQVVGATWDFGDGSDDTGLVVTHAYSAPGTYTVSLTLVDAFGRTVTAARSVQVLAGGTPNASFTRSPSTPNLGETVFFNASASSAPAGRTIVSFEWTFGDGGTASGVTASHTYTAVGSYTATLTITDSRGATGATTLGVIVSSSRPTASFIFSPTAPRVNEPVFFDASASRAGVVGRTIVSYAWVFGDGSTGTGRTTTHEYSFASTFTVSLTVTDSVGETNTSTGSVTIGGAGARPSARFTVSPNPTTIDLFTTVDASTSTASPGARIIRYDWDFGETGARFQCPGDAGCGDQDRTFVYVYTRPGRYTINLTITDSTEQTAATTASITVNSVGDPTASFTASPNPAVAGAIVGFDASASSANGGRSIVSYAWNFGDQMTATVVTPTTTHSFAVAGTYTVSLTVTDSAGASSITSTTVTITP